MRALIVIMNLVLVGIPGKSGIYCEHQAGGRNIAVCGVYSEESLVGTKPVEFIGESSLSMGFGENVIDTPENHRSCIGCAAVKQRNAFFGPGELLSKGAALARKKSHASDEFADRFFLQVFARLPPSRGVSHTDCSGKKLTLDGGISSRSATDIFHLELDNDRSPRWSEVKFATRFGTDNVNPRPLISFHETQLALDDAQLILSRLSLPSYAFVRASQFQELKDGDKAKGDGRGGQNGGPPNKSASQPNYGLLAYALVVLLLGFFCVLGGGGCFVYWGGWRRCLTLSVGLLGLAILCIGHGLVSIVAAIGPV
jgi:hypothetical protein